MSVQPYFGEKRKQGEEKYQVLQKREENKN